MHGANITIHIIFLLTINPPLIARSWDLFNLVIKGYMLKYIKMTLFFMKVPSSFHAPMISTSLDVVNDMYCCIFSDRNFSITYAWFGVK